MCFIKKNRKKIELLTWDWDYSGFIRVKVRKKKLILGGRVWLFCILELLNWGLGFGELGFD